jgi:lipoprotein-anchoring transpeptidase ErfK/SrfK
MIKREAAKGHKIPAFMEGGPGNPLGARAMYIGGTIYRIHGTNNAASIGGAVSSGCIRMMNADVIELYEKVKVGARVYVYQ